MPSAQVINFGEDPYANAMGGFAESFLGTLNEKTAQKRNENIFSKIKEKYGPDAEPETIFRDVLESEGLDQDYKRNKLNEIKEFASLSTKAKITPYQQAMLDMRTDELNLKKNKADETVEKPITAYQKKVLANQETRLALDRQRLDQAAKTNDAKFPEQLDKYTTNILKDADVKLPPHDKADLNGFIDQLMKEEGLGINDAFNRAYQYIEARRDKVDNVQITERPTSWVGSPNQSEVTRNMDEAYQQLKALYEEDGIDNQKELRSIAARAGWQPDEITKMLQRVFQVHGKQLASPRARKSAEIPFKEQGVAAEEGGLDDLLFGE